MKTTIGAKSYLVMVLVFGYDALVVVDDVEEEGAKAGHSLGYLHALRNPHIRSARTHFTPNLRVQHEAVRHEIPW